MIGFVGLLLDEPVQALLDKNSGLRAGLDFMFARCGLKFGCVQMVGLEAVIFPITMFGV